MNHKLTLIKLLGLGETEDAATDEQINNAASTFQDEMVQYKNKLDEENTKLRNSNTSAISKADSADALIKAANDAKEVAVTENKTLREELVNRDLETYAEVIVNKEDVKEQLLANREGTIKILRGIKKSASVAAPLYNSKKAGQPAPVTESEHPVSQTDAVKISNRTRELQKLGLSHQQAFMQAKGEVVEATA